MSGSPAIRHLHGLVQTLGKYENAYMEHLAGSGILARKE
jgi:hypothetical protein